MRRVALALALALGLTSGALAATRVPPDAPELALPGPFAVGMANLPFERRGGDPRGRRLQVDVWYPAAAPSGPPIVYRGALTGENGEDVAFTNPGVAIEGAALAPGSFPLLILAHGYGGTPVAMTWLSENLASKGYVVVGPHFGDPPITDASKMVGPVTRRPLDIAYVAETAQRMARAGQGPLRFADAARTVLVGYSMGGYGVLTDAGGALNPALAAMTSGGLADYVSGAPAARSLKVAGLKAVVAISPAGRFGATSAWSHKGLAIITAPTLFIVGDADDLVGYDPGVKTLFEAETSAPRYLLTFENAGHSIGMDAAPPGMRGALWDQDWFEDPVWRKDRVTAIQLHFITAFLGFYVKGDTSKRSYLEVATPRSADGVWLPRANEPWSAYASGAPPGTFWKGFQRGHARGLELRFAAPSTAPPG